MNANYSTAYQSWRGTPMILVHAKASMLAVVVTSTLVVACGGIVSSQTDGGSDASAIDGMNGDAGWTSCASPSGYELCGGPNNCNADCNSFLCIPIGNASGSVGLCTDPPAPDPITALGCIGCDDGTMCVVDAFSTPTGPVEGLCTVPEAAELARRAGAQLLYTDFMPYDGTALPAPSDCPTVVGLTLCGGTCGDTCVKDGNHICIGGSPKHPYGVCVQLSPSINIPWLYTRQSRRGRWPWVFHLPRRCDQPTRRRQ